MANAEEVLARLEAHATALGHYAENVNELLAGLNNGGVLWSGTVQLGADGVRIVDARVPFMAATITPHGADVIATEGASTSSAQPIGAGVFVVRGGVTRTLAIMGRQLVLTGLAGATVMVTLWVRPMPPQGGDTHGWGADVTATSPARIAGAAAATTLAAANPARRGLSIFHENAPATVLYVKLGPAASVTDYTVQIVGASFYELPGPPFYRGIVTGTWSAAVGFAQVTELT